MRNTAFHYQTWCDHVEPTSELFQELLAMQGNDQTIEDRFYSDLAFGTGGLRGVLGVGTNRMNRYTVAKATRGLADYLHQISDTPSCAIAYDSRNKSFEFAKVAAATLAQTGIKVHLYDRLMPTPMLSFAVRDLHTTAGIVITASHNPGIYNGYKVYGQDGCQITQEAADRIQSSIANQADFIDNYPDFDTLFASGTIVSIAESVIDRYFEAVKQVSTGFPTTQLHVVFTPLNGAGNLPVRRMLQEMGHISVTVVPEQELPDGNFPTCPYPNPEIEQAMSLAIELLQQTGADFALATDPDCDRAGVAALDSTGKVHLINGNEMGCMLFDYICTCRKRAGNLPSNPVAVKTIVTSELATAIARHHGVELRNVLTGFKYIGEQIGLLEQQGQANRYLFGFEESYGYLSGSYVRDKDAVNAAMLICEMASYYKAQGKSLLDVLTALYQRFGYYKNELLTFVFEGATGMTQMEAILNQLRQNPPTTFANLAVQSMTDYLASDTGLPKSNVLHLALTENCHVILRPSGTEPKLKLYLTAVDQTDQTATARLQALVQHCTAYIQSKQ